MNELIAWYWLLDIDFGDAPAWVAIGVTFLFSLAAFVVSLKGLKWQRMSAEATVRAANATEKAAAFEQILGEERREMADPGQPAKELTRSGVRWQIENVINSRYALRNVGSVVATGVTVDESQVLAPARLLPKDAAVRPDEAVEFLIFGTFQHPMPTELWVTWDGQEQPIAVPFRRGTFIDHAARL
ncbi:hypothetical protein ACIBEJ_35020 [Nonomuraea sp. NPDC050790]|uniref:hypothetical protein n=1 Tax=Nonomuraea sp. NPDC050790 TaxID=3364371 RepID=UPI0037B1EA5A